MTNLSFMFYGISSLNSETDFSDFDTTNIINMSYMFSNCSTMKKLPNSIVSPISFYENKDMGFATIISPYIYQARCLSNEYGSWGAFVPEPDYRYVPYTPEQQKELLPWKTAIDHV